PPWRGPRAGGGGAGVGPRLSVAAATPGARRGPPQHGARADRLRRVSDPLHGARRRRRPPAGRGGPDRLRAHAGEAAPGAPDVGARRPRGRGDRRGPAAGVWRAPEAVSGRDHGEPLIESLAVRKLTTGVPGLDIITHGGIPEGRSVLITGRSGTGKTILALQMAAHLGRAGTKTILLAVEESPDDLLLTGDGLGMDLSGLVRSGALRVTDASRPMEAPMVVSGESDISGLIHRVAAIAKQT